MRNQNYEQVLLNEGLEYDYVEAVNMEDISQSKSLNNQARLEEPVDKVLLEAYTSMLKAGMEAPPLVLWRPGKGMWIIVDGNHRFLARQALNLKTVDAYILRNTDPLVIDRTTWRFNNLVNGKRLSYDECVMHAVQFVRKHNYSQAQAAKEWGVKPGTVASKCALEVGREILAKHGAKVLPGETGDETVRAFNPLIQMGEDVFVAAVKAAVVVGATRDDAVDLVRKVRRAETTEQKMRVLYDYSNSPQALERRAETKNGTVKTKRVRPRDTFIKVLKQLWRIVEDYQWETIEPLVNDYKECRPLAEDVVKRLVRGFQFKEVK